MVKLLVEDWNAMVKDVPDVVECVEYEESGKRLPDELEQRRSTRRQLDCRKPDPLRRTQRQNEQQLVPHGITETEPRMRPCYSHIGVDLVSAMHPTDCSVLQ